MNRRAFLTGLFGAAAVAAAGPLPAILETIPEQEFKAAAKAIQPRWNEVYGKGNEYAFARIEYLNEAPWMRITVPEGFRPLREESDRIGAEAIARMKSS